MSIYHVCLELDKTGIYEWLNYKQPNDIKINEITIFSVKTKWFKNKWNNNLFFKKKTNACDAFCVVAWSPFFPAKNGDLLPAKNGDWVSGFCQRWLYCEHDLPCANWPFFVPWTGRSRPLCCVAVCVPSCGQGPRALVFFCCCFLRSQVPRTRVCTGQTWGPVGPTSFFAPQQVSMGLRADRDRRGRFVVGLGADHSGGSGRSFRLLPLV